MFWKKDKKNKNYAPSMPTVYSSGAVAYNGGDEVYSIVMACLFAVQVYETTKKLAPKKAAEMAPYAEKWALLIQKNAEYMEKCVSAD